MNENVKSDTIIANEMAMKTLNGKENKPIEPKRTNAFVFLPK